jgi:hypothetical protein
MPVFTDRQYAALLDLLVPPATEAAVADALGGVGALATLKFDRYEQYPPLTTFADALLAWLRQAAAADRAAMLTWLHHNLVFISPEQMRSLVQAFADDWLVTATMQLAATAQLAGSGGEDRNGGSRQAAVEQHLRGTAVCALSDGVPLAALRRATRYLSHDQFWTDIRSLLVSRPRLRHVVLVDDFSGTGKSLAFRTDDGSCVGRIGNLHEALRDWPAGPGGDACPGDAGLGDVATPAVSLVLLIATADALEHLAGLLAPWGYGVHALQVISAPPVTAEAEWSARYLGITPDPTAKTHINAGYRGGNLPLVLHHNTPNDSYALLWSSGTPGGRPWQPLFPRVDRIRDDS